jgi:acetyl-CoA carboxylase beta subunit
MKRRYDMAGKSWTKKKKKGVVLWKKPKHQQIGLLQLWYKCPECKNIVYSKEVELENKCPSCNYILPYPYAKVRKIERFRATKPTWNEFSNLVLKTLNTIKKSSQRIAFMSQVLGITVSYHERWICSTCTRKK